jgi:POT family proton-dependent oligopeptide transporter
VPFLIAYWRWQVKRGKGTGDLYKIAIGSLLIAVSCAILAAGAWSVQASGAKVAVWYPLVALGITGISFMWYWPITLAFVSRHAPPQVTALMMAGTYLVAFFSGIGSGFIGRYYEPLGPTNFWLLNAGFGIAGALCVLLFGPALHRWAAQLETRTSAMQSPHNKPLKNDAASGAS